MTKEIIFYGRGGQGAVTAASLLVTAADYEGKHAQAFPFFGFERRGAPVTAYLRIDERHITMRGRINNPDCIIVLDPKLPEIIDVYKGLKDGGIAILNAYELSGKAHFNVKPSKIAIVNANAISDQVFGARPIPMTNTVMLGSFSRATEWISLSSIIKAIEHKFDWRLREENIKAVKLGYEGTVIKQEFNVDEESEC